MSQNVMNFDEFYSRKSRYFSYQHSDGMENVIKKYDIKPCTALDIGAGEGRNSLYLAEKGFDVIAVEPSIIGANKIIEQSSVKRVSIKVYQNDFLSILNEVNDIGFVVSLTSLEHMEYNYMLETIKEIKRIMKPDGFIYVVAFTVDDPGFKHDVANASECSMFIKHYFEKDELRLLFSDFEILEYSEYMKEDTLHGPIHVHGKAKLFARKPNEDIS